MASALTAKQCVEVVLVRPGVGPQTFTLREGATLADLLREVGATVSNPNLLVDIDGRPIEELVLLKSGMKVTLAHNPSGSIRRRSWMDSVGTVQDTPAFQEMIAAGRAIREADEEAAHDQIDQDEV
jgi:sulfur carrier protein ThiS